jgi:hypothetical protein
MGWIHGRRPPSVTLEVRRSVESSLMASDRVALVASACRARASKLNRTDGSPSAAGAWLDCPQALSTWAVGTAGREGGWRWRLNGWRGHGPSERQARPPRRQSCWLGTIMGLSRGGWLLRGGGTWCDDYWSMRQSASLVREIFWEIIL